MPKVLVVDQDESLLIQICSWLESQHLTVETASTGAACQKLLAKHLFDVVVLDWHLAAPTGLEMIKWFRSRGGRSPLLVLMGSDDIEDKVAAFAAGADDCLSKPFALRELAIRVNALRRRSMTSYTRIVEGPLTIDPTMHTASISGHMLSLTATEFALLEYIALHPNNVLSPTVLLNNVWKDSMDTSCDTVRAYVKRLRQKLEAVGYRNLIENVHGVGYRLNATAAETAQVAGFPVGSLASAFAPY
ncbi:MAG: response regulator transcription factor [Candidatus Obscuribacterales bacterium]